MCRWNWVGSRIGFGKMCTFAWSLSCVTCYYGWWNETRSNNLVWTNAYLRLASSRGSDAPGKNCSRLPTALVNWNIFIKRSFNLISDSTVFSYIIQGSNSTGTASSDLIMLLNTRYGSSGSLQSTPTSVSTPFSSNTTLSHNDQDQRKFAGFVTGLIK